MRQRTPRSACHDYPRAIKWAIPVRLTGRSHWRGRPLRPYETIINLIGNTTNRGGLVVRARLDRRNYATGKKVSAEELRALKIERNEFHGDWNYAIRPRSEMR